MSADAVNVLSRALPLILIASILGGCQPGFEHVGAIVPPLEILLDVTDPNLQGRQIDLVRASLY